MVFDHPVCQSWPVASGAGSLKDRRLIGSYHQNMTQTAAIELTANFVIEIDPAQAFLIKLQILLESNQSHGLRRLSPINSTEVAAVQEVFSQEELEIFVGRSD
jgi:hypothetical protein